MGLLYFLADTFISTFGITEPTPTARRHAAFFILGLIVLALFTAVAAFFLLHFWMR